MDYQELQHKAKAKFKELKMDRHLWKVKDATRFFIDSRQLDENETYGITNLSVEHVNLERFHKKFIDKLLFGEFRSGPIRLNSCRSFLSGVSADAYAASLPVGSITVYASSGVCLPRLECGLD